MADQIKAEELMSAAQLHQMAEEQAMAEAKKVHEKMKQAELAHREMREAFMSREIRPDGMQRLMTAIKHAIAIGKSEIMIVQFPSDLLSDRGRRINNFEPDWADTLEGFAKRAHEFYKTNLEARGYKVRAQIIDYPGGKPGDVGLYLSW